jgi:hypothetical protein
MNGRQKREFRRGIAVPVVLALIMSLASIGIFIFRWMQQQNRQNITSFHELQAHFIARAGMEHALLKVKFLQRELYDSACLTQGRNPLFDFSRKLDEFTNPGPAFLYRSGEATPNLETFLTPGFAAQFANRRNPPETWVNSFISDLISGTHLSLGLGKDLRVNSIMEMDRFPMARDFFVSPLKKAAYRVAALEMTAQQTEDSKEKVSNQMVVEITVEAELQSESGEKRKQQLKRTLRVSRDPKF